MQYQEFMNDIGRLIEVYGERSYPDARVKQIWNAVKWRHQVVFTEAVDNLIGDSERAPMKNKIIEACQVSQRNHPELESDPYAPVRKELVAARDHVSQCKKCSNTGVVDIFRKYWGLGTAMLLCDCWVGDIAKRLPEYRHEKKREQHDSIYVLFTNDPNLDAKMEFYRDLYLQPGEERQRILEKMYFDTEMHVQPYSYRPSWYVEWHTKEQIQDINAAFISLKKTNSAETKKQILGYINGFKKDERDLED